MGAKPISRHLHHRQALAAASLPVLQFVCLIALATANIPAAEPAGRISGRITDPQDATVSQAHIKVTDQIRSTVCQTVSDVQGYFSCSSIGAGEFSVTATAPAFDPVTMTLRVEGVKN